MLTTPHTATGIAIGVLLPNPVIALPLAFVSHFVLDQIPHWQETLYPYEPNRMTWIRVPIDLAVSVFLVTWAASLHPGLTGNIWLSAFVANLPDFDSAVSLNRDFLKEKLVKRFWDWHNSIQRETSSWVGLLPQLAVLLLSIFLFR